MSSNVDRDSEIMLLLLEADRMSYRGIEKKTGFNDRTVRRHLKWLTKQGLIKQDKVADERGRPHYNSLTEKGERQLVRAYVNDLNQVFARTQRVMGMLEKKPTKLRQFREFLKQHPHLPNPKAGHFTKPEIDEHMRKVKETHGPLIEALKALRHIYLQVYYGKPDGEVPNVAVSITKEGWVYLTSVEQLKKHGLGAGL